MNSLSRAKKLLIRLAFALICLVTLGALFVAEENWRGSRAWASYKESLEAKGERFDIARLIPAAVPDDQNLAMLPFFTRHETVHLPDPNPPHDHTLGPWRVDAATEMTNWAAAYGLPTAAPEILASGILAALDRQEPLIDELRDARHRPFCRCNIDYENWMSRTNVEDALLAQMSQARALVRVLSLRAQAELVAGKSDRALDDIEVMLRVISGVQEVPLVISQLVGYACLRVALQPVAQGLAAHRWSDSQLQRVQERLARVDLLAAGRKAFAGERDICGNAFFNSTVMGLRGWTRLEQLNFNRASELTVFRRIDLASRRIDPAVNASCDQLLSNMMQHPLLHHTIMLQSTAAASTKVCRHTAAAQTDVDEMRVACALERFRLVDGRYPEKLQQLVPRFSALLPDDVITGQPLKYRLSTDGNFMIYSIGWNDADDGGQVAYAKDGRPDPSRGDWTFQP